MLSMLNRTVFLCLTIVAVTNICFAQSDGEAIYKTKCQTCHGETGAANTPVAKMLNVKPLNGLLVKMSEGRLSAIIEDGAGKMPAYKGKFSPIQLKALVLYTDHLQSQK